MAKLQAFKRIISEDYPSQYRSLVGQLAYSINSLADDVLNALNKNISVKDNTNLSQKTISVTVDANGVPTTSTSVSTGLASACVGIQVINAVNQTDSNAIPTSAPFISFTNTTDGIKINKISGLQATNNYNLTVIFYV